MSKYRIVNVPDVKEAKCVNCGSAKNDGRLYIDVNLDIDWYGTVFFCGLCLRELASAMGLFAELEQKVSALITRREQDERLLEIGERLNESARLMVSEFKEFYAALHPSELVDSTDSGSNLVSEESTTEQGPTGSNSNSDKSKSRIAKSTSSTGRQNVRSLAELLDDTD